jgi:SagB-type dehydrogenase family enzyme
MDSRDLEQHIENGRRFLRAEWELFDGLATDQDRGVPAPPQEKPAPEGAQVLSLPPVDALTFGSMPLRDAIRTRRSRRKFAADPLGLDALSYLLWATQGVREGGPIRSMRMVPSAGARHCLETYLYLARIKGVEPGLWRYQPLEHELVLLRSGDDLAAELDDALMEQLWNAAAVFVWAAIPYRMEWRYSIVSHKVIALDAGHVCQNLYLACESIGFGTCAIGAYDQQKLDRFLGVDGRDEFVIYAAPVGKKPIAGTD